MHYGNRVTLVSFHGKRLAPETIESAENYWKLVRETGIIRSNHKRLHSFYADKGEQVLVAFDCDLDDLKLISHNEHENSLWIFISDLEIIATV